MQMTLAAYQTLLGEGARMFITGAVVCFGTATVLCWIQYAAVALTYLLGNAEKGKRYSVCLLSIASLFGAVMQAQSVFTVTDAAIAGMILLNLVYLWIGRKEIIESTERFRRKRSVP